MSRAPVSVAADELTGVATVLVDELERRGELETVPAALELVDVGARLDLAFVPSVSTWQGRRSAELEVADFAIVS